jgi:DNA-binding response OmpR family regulator
MPHSHPVLIAEDDEDMIFLLERSLRKIGLRNPIKIVSDGEQAVRYLEDDVTHKSPHLAVLDIKMPLKDGFDVLKRVRANPKLSRMPVIIFSSSSSESDVTRAYDLGANSYVVKPGDSIGLDKVVAMIQEYWLTINRAAQTSAA